MSADAKLFREGAQTCEALAIYERVARVPGYFNADDATHFALVLGMQNFAGPSGDILEIGTWFGRSAGYLATFIRPGERLVVCDAFERETTDKYTRRPSQQDLRRNVKLIAPGFDLDALVVHDCLSSDLRLDPGIRFRCVHVDGGHAHDEALGDLRLVADHVIPGGLIIVDDFRHETWPGVTTAVHQFLAERPDIRLMCSVNRHGAIGQKGYLVRCA
jgi:predicted O-methyltransferase YrrM